MRMKSAALLCMAALAAAASPVASGRYARAGKSMREGACAVVMPGGDAYVFGGADSAAADRLRADSIESVAPLPGPRSGAACVALTDQRILVAGGEAFGTPLASIEVYDPAADTWTSAGSLVVARAGASATALTDGRVMIAGGRTASGESNLIELIGPSGARIASARLHEARHGHAAALLPNGSVLIAGGQSALGPLASTEIVTEDSAAAGPRLSEPRARASAQRTRDGLILLLGEDRGQASAADVYDPAAGVLTTARTIVFSGYTWWVKTGAGSRVGPGPNYFSDLPENVSVDALGRLRLRITRVGSQWRCAELVSVDSFGHGTYRFYLDSDVGRLDPNVVLGLFTWKSGDSSHYSRELDIEVARWGVTNSVTNAQYTVQPGGDGNSHKFVLPAGLAQTTHAFTWTPTAFAARSLLGHRATPESPANVIAEHTFTAGIPPAGGENIRINLWLFLGRAPKNRTSVEVLVNRFEFVP